MLVAVGPLAGEVMESVTSWERNVELAESYRLGFSEILHEFLKIA